MRYLLSSLAVIVFFLQSQIFFEKVARAETNNDLSIKVALETPFVDGRLLIKRKAGIQMRVLNEVHTKLGSVVIERYEFPENLELVEIPKTMSMREAMERYESDPSVRYVEPDYILHTEVIPNDPRFPEQWALDNSGQTGGLADADINGPAIWDLTTGSEDVIVGVIDTGIEYTHPDLIDNMWHNPGEIPGNNIDDDGNGYIDDVFGINAINKKGDPMDDNGHGTHCAGIIAAKGNNGIGVSGISQNASLIGCKFLDRGGSGATSDALTCVNYFAALKTRTTNPVNVVVTSNSWSGGPFSQAMFDAISQHETQGILFVAAASNSSVNNDIMDTYPANYALSNMISVAATDKNDKLAYFSNYGERTVHVGAPGVDILSTFLRGGYEKLSGTSMAAPYVTGLAAILKAQDPSRSVSTIRNLIISGGQPLAELASKTISGRRIRAADVNGFGSATCVGQSVDKRLSPSKSRLAIAKGSQVALTKIKIQCEKSGDPESIDLIGTGESIPLEDKGERGDSRANDGVFVNAWQPVSAGNYQLRFQSGEEISVSVFDHSAWKSYRPLVQTPMVYRDILGAGLDVGDETVHAVSAPFPIRFAGDPAGFDTIYVSSNGAISFTQNTPLGWQNQRLPLSSIQTLLAVFWDDLTGTGSGDVVVQTLGEAPSREFVVEWRDMKHYESTNPFTFQAVFFENSPEILLNYKDADAGGRQNDGKSATIGVQISERSATLFGFNEAVVSSGFSLRYVLNNPPIANAGENQNVQQGDLVTLNGGASVDPDEMTLLQYQWEQIEGPSVVLSDAKAASPTFSASTAGTLVFRLTVIDDGGEKDSAQVGVNVAPLAASLNQGGGSGSTNPNNAKPDQDPLTGVKADIEPRNASPNNDLSAAMATFNNAAMGCSAHSQQANPMFLVQIAFVLWQLRRACRKGDKK